MKEENLRFYSMAAGVILALLVLLLCASSLASVEQDAYICPVDDNMRIYVNACLNERYSFGDCYYAYVDSQCFGSVPLDMPTNWA